MNKIRTLGCIALLASLAACQDKAPATSTASNAPAKPAEPGGLTGMIGAAMDKARAEMATKNISIGNGVHVNINGHEINTPDDKAPHAEITPQGDLLVEGKPVDITPAQRALLLQYRGEIIGVASAGMEIGKQGVDIAGKAVGTAIASIFNGKNDQAEQEMKAQTAENRARVVLAEAEVPLAMAAAFSGGNFNLHHGTTNGDRPGSGR